MSLRRLTSFLIPLLHCAPLPQPPAAVAGAMVVAVAGAVAAVTPARSALVVNVAVRPLKSTHMLLGCLALNPSRPCNSLT